jgi:hypothetical protein
MHQKSENAADKQHSLKLRHCMLNDECVEALQKVLRSPRLQNFQELWLVDVKVKQKKITKCIELLSCISKFEFSNLRKVRISITNMNTQGKENFQALLTKNRIESLHLECCSFTEEVCHALVAAFP